MENVMSKVKELNFEGRLQQALEKDNSVSRVFNSTLSLLKRKETIIAILIAGVAGFIQRLNLL